MTLGFETTEYHAGMRRDRTRFRQAREEMKIDRNILRGRQPCEQARWHQRLVQLDPFSRCEHIPTRFGLIRADPTRGDDQPRAEASVMERVKLAPSIGICAQPAISFGALTPTSSSKVGTRSLAWTN